MILNQSVSTVQTVGDVSEHQISIDAQNLEHIISILSTNLYSNPEQSFLREITCNAVDSHIEAGTKEPVIITFAFDSASLDYVVSVRDYGTGISPERFKNIYLNIGSSTKRESNDYIGSFGIGRFSALACADMVHITSYYNGMQYQYLMLKNGTKINIDLLCEIPTEEHNGVEVKIHVNSLTLYRRALKYLWFIPNVYVNDISQPIPIEQLSVTNFNERKLYHFNHFTYNTVDDTKLFVLHGTVLYPIDQSVLPNAFSDSINVNHIWKKVIPKFNIGELEVTPNREQLLYSDKTKKAISERYAEVIKELSTICEQTTSNYQDIFDYYRAVSKVFVPVPIRVVDDNTTLYITVHSSGLLKSTININYKDGDPLIEDRSVRNALNELTTNYPLEFFYESIIFCDGKYLTQKQARLRFFNFDDIVNNSKYVVRVFFVPKFDGLRSEICKEYLNKKARVIENSTGKEAVFIFTTDSPKISHILKHRGTKVLNGAMMDKHKSLWLLREYLRSITNIKFYKYDLCTSADYVKFRKEELELRKLERKQASKQFSQQVTFYYQAIKNEYEHHIDKIKATNVDELIANVNKWCISDFRKKTVPVYWSVISDPLLSIWKEFALNRQNYILLTVAQTNLKYLEKATLPTNWQRPSTDFILNSSYFRRWVTKKKFMKLIGSSSYSLMMDSLNSEEKELVEKAKQNFTHEEQFWNNTTLQNLEGQYTGYYDQEMIAGYNIIEKYWQIGQKADGIIKLSEEEGYVTPLVMYTAMKRKLLRPNWDTYRHIMYTLNPNRKELEIKKDEKVD